MEGKKRGLPREAIASFIGGVNNLYDLFPEQTHESLSVVCCELVNNGLMVDDGVNRYDIRGMNWFKATGLGEWLIRYIARP